MLTRAHSIERRLGQMPRADADAWRRWLAIHQLDPDRILLGTWLVIDDDARTVEATYVVKDEDGWPKITDDHVVTEQVVRHLESKPLPFPGLGVGS